MEQRRDDRPRLAERAGAALDSLQQEERERLLVKCWMSFDSRWFMAVATAFGLEAANRLNKTAAHEVGRAEAPAFVRALELPPVASAENFLALQEALIGLLGPDLLDYAVVKTGEDEWQIQVRRCFAHENVARAGVAGQYECGIFSRVTGWLEGLGIEYEMTPSLGKCLKADGRDCAYAFKLRTGSAG